MSVPTFDIFWGAFGTTNVIWLEAVEGLGAAKKRMNEIARKQPGRYFVFSAHERALLASINTQRGAINRDLKVG